MWSTLATEEIRTKDQAADWAIPRLPDEHRSILALARDGYLGRTGDDWRPILPAARELAVAMAAEIRRAA
jgi:streptomycin 3"-adenylyltransferase